MVRKIIFWTHLASGVAAGIVIFSMSLTGVLLTYEQQILHWFEQRDYLASGETGQSRLPLEQLAGIAERENPDLTFRSATVLNHPGAPVELGAGRRAPSVQLNPFTGQTMETGAPVLESFFSATTGFHRWFNLSGDGRAAARAITGAANLLFLFLIVSGLYLWLPKVWKWAAFKTRLWFNARAESGKARDFNWHHVFGIWSAIPLAVVVATASVFYYDWANDLVYWTFGDPDEGGTAAAVVRLEEGGGTSGNNTGADVQTASFLPLNELVAKAGEAVPSWHSISVTLPDQAQSIVEVSLDQSLGRQPQFRHDLVLDRVSGEVLYHRPFSERPAGSQARTIIRYLHTGEVLGFWGQTIAGLVSLTSLLMVWTGLALAWRRLIRPLFRG